MDIDLHWSQEDRATQKWARLTHFPYNVSAASPARATSSASVASAPSALQSSLYWSLSSGEGSCETRCWFYQDELYMGIFLNINSIQLTSYSDWPMGHFSASEQEDWRVLELPFTAPPLKQLNGFLCFVFRSSVFKRHCCRPIESKLSRLQKLS